MKIQSKTTILFASAIVFAIAMACIYGFFFVSMKKKTDDTATILARSAELSGKESYTLLTLSTLKTESTNIEKLSSYFVKEDEVVVFAKTIEALGKQSDTILTIESLDQGLTEKSVPLLNFRIKANGQFLNIMRLLVLIENFPGKFEMKTIRFVRIDDINPQTSVFVSKTKIDRVPVWSVEMSLTALNFIKE